GEDFYPGTFDPALVDRWMRVSDRDSFLTARRLTREEGILVGGSSGTAMFAALEIAKELDASALIVVLFADSGRSYLSKIYNDEWMRQNGFLARYPVHATVLDVVKDRMGTPGLIVVSKGETVRAAIETMQRYGISQIPVVADGEATKIGDIVGSVSERAMLDRVFRDPSLVEQKVEQVMESPCPRSASQRRAPAFVPGEVAQRLAKCRGVTDGNQHGRAAGDLACRGDVTRDDRQSVCEGVGHGHPVRLAGRREREDRGHRIPP